MNDVRRIRRWLVAERHVLRRPDFRKLDAVIKDLLAICGHGKNKDRTQPEHFVPTVSRPNRPVQTGPTLGEAWSTAGLRIYLLNAAMSEKSAGLPTSAPGSF